MGEHIFRILLKDLTTVRITCGHCEGIIELPIETVGATLAKPFCPLCREPFAVSPKAATMGDAPYFIQLQEAIAAMRRLETVFTVEFPIKLQN